ncbi:MAG: hypothetical protein K2L88_01685, partial [Clostridiales bacterium]|nr:hypothetical protein [Clostridiales bacterium]
TSYKDKLNSVYAYVKRLTDSDEPDAIDLIQATNSLIDELGAQLLTKQTFGAVAEFCAARGMTNITSAIRDSAERFFNLVKKITSAEVGAYGDYLPDLVAEINTLQSNKYEAENAATVGDITTELLDEEGDKASVKEMVERLVAITVADVLDLPEIDLPASYKPAKADSSETLFAKLDELKTAVLDRPTPTIIPTSPDGELSVDEAALQQILYAVDDLKNKLENATGNDDMSGALEELRNNYIDITNRIVDISEKLQEPITVETAAMGSAGISDEERQVMLDDLGYIRARIDEYDAFFNSIADLRADIAAIGGTTEISEQLAEQVSSLIADITAQFDKLYEDVTNVIIESEANIINKIGEGAGSSDTAEVIETAKTEILAETQALKDSLVTVSDAILMSPTTEAIEQLRTDVNSFMDLSSASTEAAAADRQRLLDDIAFLREQAELAIAESEQIPDAAEAVQDTEKFISYLDEIAARVALINTVAEDTAATKETVNEITNNVAVITDTITSVTDSVNTVSDTLSAITDSVAAVSDSIASINDNFVAVNDNFAVINDNVTAVADNVNVVNDNINAISENAVAARDAATATLDALTPITEQLNSILDRLDTPIVEQEVTEEEVVTTDAASEELEGIKDNINAILDTLTLMPQEEDVTVIRDNVAAVLDAINVLTETLTANTEGEEAEDGGAQAVVVEDIIALQDAVNVANEDIKLLLERIESYEQTAANNKQEIIDTVSGIREEIHINTLDENMSASGMDEETRDALLGEIAEIRERLGNIEASTQAVSDVNVTAIEGISAQLAELQAALEAQLTTEESVEDGGEQLDSDTMQALIAELSAIKEKLDAPSEYDTVEEILSLREDIKAARIVDQD